MVQEEWKENLPQLPILCVLAHFTKNMKDEKQQSEADAQSAEKWKGYGYEKEESK